MAKFPKIPMFEGIHAPSRIEVDIHDLEVEGDIPADLDGAFYRVAPDFQYPPRFENDVPFNADGTVSMFRFRNGRVDLKHRYVRTDRFQLEREAGRALFGRYRNPFTDEPCVQGKNRGLANTNVLVHNGVLFAMKEDSPPVAMDPLTLETIGNWNFGGALDSQTFTAHPKIDPETGQMLAFAFGAKGLMSRDAVYYEISSTGRITREVWFEMPYYCMLHDFGVTRDYVVFPIIPVVGTIELLKAGLPHYGWDSTKDIYLGVLPRDGESRDIRWFHAPNQFASHVMNAFNDGAKVHIDMPVAESTMFPFFPDVAGTPWHPQKAMSRVTRWTVDMGSKSDTFRSAEQLTDFVGEFPRMDDRYIAAPYRHGWLLGFWGVRSALGHVDHAIGKTSSWEAGEKTSLQEPCFLPKPNSVAEGDGYVIQVATHHDEMRTDVYLYEALRIEEGPFAKLKLPLRLRPGYHGSWATGEQIARSQSASAAGA
jgi:carotenoid cleavage dioxygenase-like enzyme